MKSEKLHADDTPVPVLAPGNGRTKTGRLWTYVCDDRPAGSREAPAMWYAYSPGHRGEHPQQHLKEFSGILQADAYAGFNARYESGSIQEAPCMAHIRRKFYDLLEAHHSPVAAEAIERIGQLYAIEEEIHGRPPSERGEVRQKRSRPLLDSLHAWLEATLPKLSRRSEDPKRQFFSIAHLITEEKLYAAFRNLRKQASAGVDGVTYEEYETNAEENIRQLHRRLVEGTYRSQPLRRVYVPKEDKGKMRPISIPALEDKLVQKVVVELMNAIYEQDFLPCSYGFRPGRGQQHSVMPYPL
jgi:Transposase IS66 family/Reverse transcriptase (RNA-dependent DNA polymerase)